MLTTRNRDYRITVDHDDDAHGFVVLSQGEDVIVIPPHLLADLIERLQREEREVAAWLAA